MSRETFDAVWLAAREPADHRSRSEELMSLLRQAWRKRGWSQVLDLGSGTGSNMRYLAPRLPGDQNWTLVDHDADLLARADPPRHVRLNRVTGDLGVAGLAAVQHAHLVTGSALLDLVSEAWLRSLVDACRSGSCGALFALTYDGRIEWSDVDPDDASVRRLVNAHQRRDKGLGAALGPSAGAAAERLFVAAGYRTWLRPSPWTLGPADTALVTSLIDGWERAACEMSPGPKFVASVRAWAERRRRAAAGASSFPTVGHLDVLALPVETP